MRLCWRHHLSSQHLPRCRIVSSGAGHSCGLHWFLPGVRSWRGAPSPLAAQGQRRIIRVSESSCCHQLQCFLMESQEQTFSEGESAHQRGFKQKTCTFPCVPQVTSISPFLSPQHPSYRVTGSLSKDYLVGDYLS